MRTISLGDVGLATALAAGGPPDATDLPGLTNTPEGAIEEAESGYVAVGGMLIDGAADDGYGVAGPALAMAPTALAWAAGEAGFINGGATVLGLPGVTDGGNVGLVEFVTPFNDAIALDTDGISTFSAGQPGAELVAWADSELWDKETYTP